MSRWLEQLEENIRARKLLRDGQSILVAVSGGLDSMVLLHALHALAEKHSWEISVAHFNHQLRGRASDADESLVRKTAKQLRLPIFVGRKNVKAFAQQNHLSIEMAARKLRHDFFARVAGRGKGNRRWAMGDGEKPIAFERIALAHHADDQVELFFLRLLRGAGGEGLAGMNWVSPSPADPKISLVRPLLDFSKSDLIEFAKENRIHFREDATNAQLDFLRNRIRHEVIPLLEKIQPALNKTILRTMEITAWETNFVLGAALDWLSRKKTQPFDKLDIAVQRMCLRLQLGTFGLRPEFDLVEKLRLAPDRLVTVGSKSFVYRDSSGMVHPQKKKVISFRGARKKIDLEEQSEIEFGGLKIFWTFQNKKGDSFAAKKNCEFFDADKISAKIILRHWKAGDRFQPIGAKSPKKLQDIFTDLKVSRAERHRRVVAVTAGGELFWVEGLRISERFKLDRKTARRLRWQWSRGNSLVAGFT